MIKVNAKEVVIDRFPDGAPAFNNVSWVNNNSDRIYIDWYFDNMGELFDLCCIVRHMQQNYPKQSIVLSIPYLPNARMDRQKDKEHDIFTLKYICEIINNLNVETVRTLDVHSPVAEALINNIINYFPMYLGRAVEYSNADVLFYPDEGAMKRYSAKYNSRPYSFGIKKRNWGSNEIVSLDVISQVDIKGKDVLIVDDICSAGGTIYHSAKKLKEFGANKIYVYVTHLENIILDNMDRLDNIVEKIYTTNSIFRGNHNKVEVFEI